MAGGSTRQCGALLARNDADATEQRSVLESTLRLEFSLEPMTTDPVSVESDRIQLLARYVLEQHDASGEWAVVVALVSDDHLQQLHLEFMGIDEPTDVMTFPMSGQGGDIAISVDHALARGAEWGNTPAEEIEFLLIHGLLHLLGWRDDDEVQRTAMLKRQKELLRAFDSSPSDIRA